MADGDGQVSVETSDNLFQQFTIHNKKLVKQQHDILIKLMNSDIWIKTRSRFCIRNRIPIQHSVCLQPHVFRIRILKSRSGFGLIKQDLHV